MTDSTTPTVVLVHGAFADSSSWNGIIPGLLAQGYPVVAAANPLRGVTSDADDVASVLAGIAGPIVLVGHSYGGIVISNAAAGNVKVKALVYVAAFAPDTGESAIDLSGQFPGSTLGPTLAPLPLAGGGNDLSIRKDAFWAQFAADVPEADATLMAATQRPVTEAALAEGAGIRRGKPSRPGSSMENWTRTSPPPPRSSWPNAPAPKGPSQSREHRTWS